MITGLSLGSKMARIRQYPRLDFWPFSTTLGTAIISEYDAAQANEGR